MLKMERGAANAAGGNRVIDMEELKKARERRASSARNPYEQARTARTEPNERPPFWAQEEDDAEQDMPRAFRRPEREEGNRGRRGNAEAEAATTRGGARERRPQQEARPARAESTARNTSPKKNSFPAGRTGRAPLYMLMILLGLLGVTIVLGMNIFAIQSIEVKGNDTMTASDIISLSGIAKGENIFKVNLGQARKNLESDPLVEVQGITRVFPDAIQITVRLRKPHGAIAYVGGYAIIDEKGFVLDVRSKLPAGQYPLVTGIDVKPCKKGQPVAGIGSDQVQVMGKVLSALYDKDAMKYIGEVNLANTEDIKLLSTDGLQIDLGQASDLPAKAQVIASTIPALRSQGHTTGVLYVTAAANPVYSSGGNAPGTQDNGDKGSGNGA